MFVYIFDRDAKPNLFQCKQKWDQNKRQKLNTITTTATMTVTNYIPETKRKSIYFTIDWI